MNNQKSIFTLLFFCLALSGFAQDDGDYVEFNDRNNVVHGVYLGFSMRYGEIDDQETYTGGFKVAYVANQQFEIGFSGNFIYSDQDYFNTAAGRREDLIGGYGGLHLEPIFFSKSRVNLSFPLLIGAGAIGQIGNNFNNEDFEEEFNEEDFDAVFVAEPGVSALFNINRYLQIEAGVKYRLSSKIDLENSPVTRINGFSGGIGVKVGVFNLGRNRYKKKLQDEE
ncbi:hypothetical protein [Maribacter sp. 2308TA10-17]|uniref:hypothetical protein n=1 Tax=Maribacter sp. 2308TA10-17 TaxID=3386276 RepID=UPI0039BCAD79